MRLYPGAALLFAAAAGNAAIAGLTPRAMSLFPRQITSIDIPVACESTCTSTIAVYQACNSNDTQGCFQICSQDTFDEFLDCFACTLNVSGTISASDEDAVNSDIADLEASCSSAGATVTGSLDSQAVATANANASAATSDALSFTSASSAVTINLSSAVSIGLGVTLHPVSTRSAGATTTHSSSPASSITSAASSAAASSAAATSAASAAGPVLSADRLVGAAAAIIAAVVLL